MATASKQTVIDPGDLDAYSDVVSLSVDALDIDPSQVRMLKLLGARQIQDLHRVSLAGMFHDDALHDEALHGIRKALDAMRPAPEPRHETRRRPLLLSVPEKASSIDLTETLLDPCILTILIANGARTLGDLRGVSVPEGMEFRAVRNKMLNWFSVELTNQSLRAMQL